MDIKRTGSGRATAISGRPPTRPKASQAPKTRGGQPLITDDINASLNAIDKEVSPRSLSGPNTKVGKKMKKPWSKKRKIITWSIVGIITLALAVLGFYAFRIAQNTGSMFDGNIFDAILKNDSLQADANGRSNILIFGTPEDDPEQKGSLLADSIMMLSIDQKTKESFTVSIPRDLWVNYDTSCNLGSSGKINAAYACALNANGGDEHQASLSFAKTVSEVVGTDVQYYVAVNYSVVRGLVDTLGGVEVTINSKDPRGISDVATGLKISNGTHLIDGETALDLSRARNSKGGYGLPQSNFDREKNQQLVLKAIQERALQTGTLLDLNKATAMTESLGNNIRTNVKTSELRTALNVAAGIRSSEMESKVLNDPKNPLVMTGPHNGQSIVRPVKGLTDYSDIYEFLKPKVSS